MNHFFEVNFSSGPLRYRFDHLQGRNELLVKAVGWKKGLHLNIFDVTAGLGRESFLLAALGCNLTLFERHPSVAKLLKEGLVRGAAAPEIAPVLARMKLVEGCAIHYLQTEKITEAPDVIYCDPMFPARTKSALVKKEMQVLQTLVGPDQDAAQLVALALKTAKKRVVVKCAQQIPPLVGIPQLSFKAKSHRFDVYLL